MPSNIIKLEPALVRRYEKQSLRRHTRRVVARILIVCEGEKTEPQYFKSFSKINRGSVVYNLDVQGIGDNTRNVVNKAIELKKIAMGSSSEYDSVWAVFDRDSFPSSDFNAAIQKAEASGIGCAWSNEAFELWFLFHFVNRITPMSRDEYKRAISREVNSSIAYKKQDAYVYKKNDPENYYVMNKYGSQENALKWAEAKSREYLNAKYAEHNPCTMVYKLVRQLIGQDEEFNRALASRL